MSARTTRVSQADGGHLPLVDFVDRHASLFVLTGAGCSTASGIPDYRDADGEWKRGRPVMVKDFLADARTRQRYWARSLIGWKRMSSARPNGAHHALAALESLGRVQLLVTQNVDGLHQMAGSRNVIDLHGRVDVVRCMHCETRLPRGEFQAALTRRNPGFANLDALEAPDGDADLEGLDFSAFDVPGCGVCDGTLKPDVVFFGESVPRKRVRLAMAALAQADAMLVVGSSLMVYSGYRFVTAMLQAGKPVAAVNLGLTRADSLLSVKVAGHCADVLAAVISALGPVRAEVD